MSVETDIVDISITQDSVTLARAGFGVPLILSHNATFAERVRYYGGTDDIAEDFASTSPERLAANALFGQKQKPTRIAVGRASGAIPTLKYTVGVHGSARSSDSRAYKIGVVGEGVTADTAAFTSGASATVAQIHSGLVTDLNTVVGKNYLATFAPLVVADFTFTADNTTEVFTKVAHGLLTGDGPIQVSNSGGALPTGLSASTDYFVIKLTADTFKLATTLAFALAGTNLTISTNGTGTQTAADTASTVSPTASFLVTGAAAGNWFGLSLEDVTALDIAITHTGTDPTNDLDAIELEDPNWYCLLTLYNSKSYVEAAATWIEAQTKLYIFDVPETEAINTSVSTGADTLKALHADGFTRTAGAYHHRPATMMAACWAGRVLPVEPGGDTWALKQLVGVSIASKLTTTNRNNLQARNANYITTGFGKSITFFGTTFDGDFIDVRRGLDWLNDDMTKGIGSVLLGADKVPYSNPGVTTIVNEIRASLDRAVNRGILRADPKPSITAPDVADIDTTSRGLRLLPDIEFDGQIEGAIHKVAIRGRVSV